jgi:hypothetical protein
MHMRPYPFCIPQLSCYGGPKSVSVENHTEMERHFIPRAYYIYLIDVKTKAAHVQRMKNNKDLGKYAHVSNDGTWLSRTEKTCMKQYTGDYL